MSLLSHQKLRQLTAKKAADGKAERSRESIGLSPEERTALAALDQAAKQRLSEIEPGSGSDGRARLPRLA
jgi:hypothetical protein